MQRFLLRESRQHLGGGFQRGQLLVRVENIEFGFVGVEGRPGIFARRIVAAVSGHARQFAGHADLELFTTSSRRSLSVVKSCTIFSGPVLAVHDCHHIGGLDLLADESSGGFLHAGLFRNPHRAEVEKHGDETPVLKTDHGRRRARQCARFGARGVGVDSG